MKCNKIFSGIGFLAAIYFLAVWGSGCAQIGSPTGGVRDSLPPVLLNAVPENGSTQFRSKTITLNFDEYIELKDIEKNALVNPTPNVPPLFNYKFRQVTIKLKDTLQPNTTYRIELGNAIQDINENNPYQKFTYVFSTGNFIDSMEFSGRVILAETGKIDTNLLVLLYSDLSDSAVFKTRPKYTTRLDSDGRFRFQNLPPGVYHVFALKDEGGQKMYNNPKMLFAFADSAVQVQTVTREVTLWAYQEEKDAPKTSSKKSRIGPLKYTVTLRNAPQDLLEPLTLTFNDAIKFDPQKILLTDTLFRPIPFQVQYGDTLNQTVQIQADWTENTPYKLVIQSGFAADTSGNTLEKSDTLSFITKRERDYASIKINFQNLERFTHPVLQFVSNNQVVASFPLKGSVFYQKLFAPGDYSLQILDDTNQNGVWDPGNYLLKRQPEKVLHIQQPVSMKANWDNERDIIL